MLYNDQQYHSIWLASDGWRVIIIDQTQLPHKFATTILETVDDAAKAIRDMQVRGAPLIGATAAYGVCLSLRQDPSDDSLSRNCKRLLATRPTAINLKWALDRMREELLPLEPSKRLKTAYRLAAKICTEDIATNEAIGNHGVELIRNVHHQFPNQQKPVNILTHCNAGWLATVDWGTALAPIYKAHNEGIPVHVWVDETRPRNQGAALTAWELLSHGIPHHVICDNAGGHLMQSGQVDLCIVGTDRTTSTGDVCNKIGTYLKALAADANNIPFYVALPSSTIDWELDNGFDIPIEERAPEEITHLQGIDEQGNIGKYRITPENSAAANPAFDVTPAKLVTALITERGVCKANKDALNSLFRATQ